MVCHVYLRVSTDDQSTGLEVQRAACEGWAASQGLPVASVSVDEGLSGSLGPEKRPGLLRALGRLEKGDVLLVQKRDRLARSVLVAAMVERLAAKQGAAIRSTDGTGNGDTPEAELLRSVVDAFAQYERALISFRTAAGLARRKDKWRQYTGEPPYGYSYVDGLLVFNEAEQGALVLARSLREDGASLRAIGAALEDAGHAPRGKSWHPSTVQRMLAYEPPEPVSF